MPKVSLTSNAQHNGPRNSLAKALRGTADPLDTAPAASDRGRARCAPPQRLIAPSVSPFSFVLSGGDRAARG